MKLVTHLSTWDKMGGAAIAAWRLHVGLRGVGVDSRMVARHKTWPGDDVSGISADVFEASDVFNRRVIAPAQAPGATLFTVEPMTTPLLEHPWIAAADVVHVHWVTFFLGIEDIEALCRAGKTVFWSFHAEWAFTGGCHYIGGTRRLAEDWDGSAQIGASLHPRVKREFDRKMKVFGSLPIQVIAPSRWMAREAEASGVFPKERIHVVPYGLDTSVFTSSAGTPDRNPEGEISFLFGCQSLLERRKGFAEMREALGLCMGDPRFAAAVERGEVRMKLFGNASATDMDLPLPATHLGMLVREERIAATLRDASVFLCPTLEDNLPNVVMEALACGCPVIGFATGGVPDMVDHGINGLLAPCGDVAALARLLLDFSWDADLRRRLSDGAKATDLSRWTLDAQANRMRSLYEEVSPSGPVGNRREVPDCLPLVTLEGSILPDFETEVNQALLAEIKELRQRKAESPKPGPQPDPAIARQLEARVAKLKEKLTTAKQRTEELQGRLNGAKARVRELEKRLAEKPKSLASRIKSFLKRR